MQSNGAEGKNTLQVLNNKASQLNVRFAYYAWVGITLTFFYFFFKFL